MLRSDDDDDDEDDDDDDDDNDYSDDRVNFLFPILVFTFHFPLRCTPTMTMTMRMRITMTTMRPWDTVVKVVDGGFGETELSREPVGHHVVMVVVVMIDNMIGIMTTFNRRRDEGSSDGWTYPTIEM